MNTIALLPRLSDFVEEYDRKVAALPAAIKAFEEAGDAIKTAVTIGGTWGKGNVDVGRVYERNLLDMLLKSAWLHAYRYLKIDTIASADDKRRFDYAMESPPPFTFENIRATFGDYIRDPRGNILRGLAEVFCSLDPAYKSHEKVKIGVKGLPKRVIISSVNSYGYGKDKIESILNALAAYQGKPLITWRELNALLEDENALLSDGVLPANRTWREPVEIVGRGIRLRRFANGNAHMIFEPDTLLDINRALAEYYGDVLADCSDDTPKPKRASTEVAKDLQYYPTPTDVIDRVLGDIYIKPGMKVLEPSCGCGRIMDAIRAKGAKPVGVEVDPGRANQARNKGHSVLHDNFLETVPIADFDAVIMNPPFYGRHYAKHVRHAMKFVKPGGTLVAILPVTARYDHGEFDNIEAGWYAIWNDLPIGSFRESGTNINTTVLKLVKKG